MRLYRSTLVLSLSLFVCFTLGAATNDSINSNLSFSAYLHKVGENNLGLLSEKYNVDISKAEAAASRIMPDPELVFEGEEDDFTLSLEYSLELGKRRARIRHAKKEEEYAILELEAYFQDLRAEAAHAFLDAILQRDLLEVKLNSYNNIYQLYRSDSLRYASGEITLNDSRQSKLEATSLLNEVYEQEAAFKSAYVLLNRYMGIRSSEVGDPQGDWDLLYRDYDLEELKALALNHRIDLQLANKGYERAHTGLKLAKAERRMDLGLTIGYKRDWKGFFPNRNSLVGGVSIPLPFSRLNKGTIRASKSAIEQSRVKRLDSEMNTEIEVSQAFFEYEAAKRQVNQFVSGMLSESKEVLEGITYQYKRGETSILEVLMAQRTYNEVQEQYLETIKNYGSNLIDLERSCGIWDIEF